MEAGPCATGTAPAPAEEAGCTPGVFRAAGRATGPGTVARGRGPEAGGPPGPSAPRLGAAPSADGMPVEESGPLGTPRCGAVPGPSAPREGGGRAPRPSPPGAGTEPNMLAADTGAGAGAGAAAGLPPTPPPIAPGRCACACPGWPAWPPPIDDGGGADRGYALGAAFKPGATCPPVCCTSAPWPTSAGTPPPIEGGAVDCGSGMRCPNWAGGIEPPGAARPPVEPRAAGGRPAPDCVAEDGTKAGARVAEMTPMPVDAGAAAAFCSGAGARGADMRPNVGGRGAENTPPGAAPACCMAATQS